MKQLIFVLAGLTAVSACSELRERRGAATDTVAQRPDLTLPDTLARRDTSVTLSSRSEQPVSPVEQQPPPIKARPKKAAAPAPRRHRTSAAAAPAAKPKPQPDTSVRAYAPTTLTDTASPPDTAVTAESTTVASADSAATSRTVPDSVTAPATDTVAASVDTGRTHDSLAVNPPDPSMTAGDTASPTVSDTTVAPAAATASTGSTTSSGTVAARTLPIGTEIHAALEDSITSRRDTVGQQVSAHVMENVIGPDGRTLIAAGAPVRFTVTQIRPSRSKSSQGRLTLRADGVALNGQLQHVKADVRPVPRELRGRGVTTSEAAKVGGGAAAGAVLGRVVGGNTRGAVIGGVAGAAAGAVVATQTATRDVVVKAKTPVVFVLTAPLVAP